MAPPDASRSRLSELARVFLKLGVISVGGPAAHIALMREEIVRRRAWISDQAFLDLVSATNLIPGPNSTEMAIHIGRVRILWDATAYERVVVRNYDDRPRRLHLSFSFAADFADVFEVRGSKRTQRGKLLEPLIHDDCVSFAYLGLDGERQSVPFETDPEGKMWIGRLKVTDDPHLIVRVTYVAQGEQPYWIDVPLSAWPR